VHWGGYYATALDIEVDPERRCLAAASPTLPFSDWKKRNESDWRLKRIESDWLRCDGTPVAVKCASVSWWACGKRRRKNSPCMRVDVLVMAGRKVRNVLIVSVLLHIAIDLALRCNMQRRVDVLRVDQAPILQEVADTPLSVSRMVHERCVRFACPSERERVPFIKKITPRAPTKPNSRKPARLAIP
jgi:hypothetical protein